MKMLQNAWYYNSFFSGDMYTSLQVVVFGVFLCNKFYSWFNLIDWIFPRPSYWMLMLLDEILFFNSLMNTSSISLLPHAQYILGHDWHIFWPKIELIKCYSISLSKVLKLHIKRYSFSKISEGVPPNHPLTGPFLQKHKVKSFADNQSHLIYTTCIIKILWNRTVNSSSAPPPPHTPKYWYEKKVTM